MIDITTEALLTSPDAFGLTTASPCQRAICRIIDGLPLGELAEDPDVVALVGGTEALGKLPNVAPAIAIILAAIRTAKTMTAGAAGSKMALTVDTSGLKHGEIPRVSIVSLKLDTSAVAFSQIVGAWEASSLLRPLILDRTADTLTVRHPSGRPVEIACVAGSKAGSGLVARWSAGVIFDEAPRMNGRQDGVVNLDDALAAVSGRLLPGASILEIGSPWSPTGTVYGQVTDAWQKPSQHVVVLRGTGPMLNPRHWTPERCAQLRERNEIAYETDVMGQFADPEQGLLSPVSVRANIRQTPLELAPIAGTPVYGAGCDPSEGGARNAFTLVVVRLDVSEVGGVILPKFRVVLAREWRGLGVNGSWAEVKRALEPYGLRELVSDSFSAGANAGLAKTVHNLDLSPLRFTASSKLAAYTELATLIHSDRVELSPDRQFVRDLLSIKKRVTQTGQMIHLPTTADGRHTDFAPALVAAIAHARHTESYNAYFEAKAASLNAMYGLFGGDKCAGHPWSLGYDLGDADREQDPARAQIISQL